MKMVKCLLFVFISVSVFGCKKVDVIDQSQTEYLDVSGVINYNSPIGQSFIPQESKLDYVRVSLSDNSSANISHSASMYIRSDDINGEIIGVSDTVTLDDCFNFEFGPECGYAGGQGSEIRFDFPETVVLTPGSIYVLQVISQNIESGLAIGIAQQDEYPAGGLIISGNFDQNRDLWFEEGYLRWDFDIQ